MMSRRPRKKGSRGRPRRLRMLEIWLVLGLTAGIVQQAAALLLIPNYLTVLTRRWEGGQALCDAAGQPTGELLSELFVFFDIETDFFGIVVVSPFFGDRVMVLASAVSGCEGPRLLAMAVDGEAGVDGLDGVSGLALVVDPLGADHLYVAGSEEGKIAIFEWTREIVAGELIVSLDYLGIVENDVDGVQHMPSPGNLVATPDGRHLIVAGGRSGSLNVFSRDESTGLLSHVQTLRDSSADDAQYFQLAGEIAVSPDGANVYLIGENALTVFARDAATGVLTLLETKREGVDAIYGLDGASDVTVSDDGLWVYAGGSGLVTFERDPGTGRLLFRQTIDADLFLAGGANQILEHKGSIFVLSRGTSDIGDGGLALFARSPISGNLGLIETLNGSSIDPLGVGGDFGEINAIALQRGFTIRVGIDVASRFGVIREVRSFFGTVQNLDPEPGPAHESPSDLLVSADGANAYLSDRGGDRVITYRVDRDTGELTYVSHVEHGVGDVTALRGPAAVDQSPDARHLYVAASDSGQIAVFDRDVVDGSLRWKGVATGAPELTLRDLTDLTVSPDGRHVYAIGAFASTLTVFERDALTGALAFVSDLPPAELGGSFGATRVLVSPDGNHVYVSSTGTGAVMVLQRNVSTGAVRYRSHVLYDVGVDDLAISGDGQWVAAFLASDNDLNVLERDPTTGDLTHSARALVTSDPQGVVGFQPGTSLVYVKVSVGGGLNVIDVTQVFAQGQVLPSESVFVRDATAITFSPGGEFLYAVTETGGFHIAYLKQARAPFPALVGTRRNGRGAVDRMADPTSVAVSPDGTRLYVTSVVDDAVTEFVLDPDTGRLRRPVSSMGIVDPRALAVSPDGRIVYVAAGDTLAQFFVSKSGSLNPGAVHSNRVDGVGGLAGVSAVAISPDGLNVYTAAKDDDAIATFTRDPDTGALAWQARIFDGMLLGRGPRPTPLIELDGLDGARDVIVSPDGRNVYVAGQLDAAIVVFRRSTTGVLSYVDTTRQSEPKIGSLTGVRGLALSPDGAFLYSAADGSDAITVFSRHRSTGILTFVEAHFDGPSGVEGLDGASMVGVSEDGSLVYVASLLSDSLVVFRRDPETGRIGVVDVLDNEVVFQHALNGARDLTVAGGFVHVASRGDDAVTTFLSPVSPVPEPTAAVLAVSAALTLAMLARRRRR